MTQGIRKGSSGLSDARVRSFSECLEAENSKGDKLAIFRCFMRSFEVYTTEKLMTTDEENPLWNPRNLFTECMEEFNQTINSDD